MPAKHTRSHSHTNELSRVETTGPPYQSLRCGGSERVEKPREYNYSGNGNAGGLTFCCSAGSQIRKIVFSTQMNRFCTSASLQMRVHLSVVHYSRYYKSYSGKHKDHDVKTIKKAAPVVRGELEKTVDKVESSIENLLIREERSRKKHSKSKRATARQNVRCSLPSRKSG